MFGETVEERLKLLETGSGDKPVEISDKEFHLIERGQGEADLTVSLSTQCILFKGLEKKKLVSPQLRVPQQSKTLHYCRAKLILIYVCTLKN